MPETKPTSNPPQNPTLNPPTTSKLSAPGNLADPTVPPVVAVPEVPVGRDRTHEKPAAHGVLIEGIINPSPKQLDPKNPAGAPTLTAACGTDAQQAANDELQEMFRKDTSEMSKDELDGHNKRVHDLHFAASGATKPTR